MKKLSYVLLAVLLMFGVVRVNAMSEDDLYDVMTKKYTIGGDQWGASEGLKVQIRRYLDEFDVSEEHCDYIAARVSDAVDILRKAGTADANKLSSKTKEDLRDLVELVSKNTSVKATVVKGGVVVKNPKTGADFYTTEAEDIVKYTGSNTGIVAVVAGISLLIVAAGSVLVVKQVKEN